MQLHTATRAVGPTLSRLAWLSVTVAVAGCAGPGLPQKTMATQLTPIHALQRDEGVFAYARISPDGRFLAYTSERQDSNNPRAFTRTMTVIDVTTDRRIFAEPGIDAYWSPDGSHLIFLSPDPALGVSIFRLADAHVFRNVAPAELGDYFSWGTLDGRDVILTIDGNYYYLNGEFRGELPAGRIAQCSDEGPLERPLLSKDGEYISAFRHGTVVVRKRTTCGGLIDTRHEGAKADFSWDGRFIAFHAKSASDDPPEIKVFDINTQTSIPVTDLLGASLFPSWTKDGRLCFRYESDRYRGFVLAEGFMANRLEEAPIAGPQPQVLRWQQVVDGPPPKTRLAVLVIWSSWNSHSPEALSAASQLQAFLERSGVDATIRAAADRSSRPDLARTLQLRYSPTLVQQALVPAAVRFTGAHNQIPSILLFRDGRLLDRRLGAQSFAELRDWIVAALREP